MESLRWISIGILLLFYAPASIADLPLTVEDLISDKGQIRLDASLAYANSDRHNFLTDEPIVVQTGETSFVTIPTRFGELKGNTDLLLATLGMRYGLTPDAELYTRASHLYESIRISDPSGKSSNSGNRFVDAWIGLNYQFSQDDTTPAVLGFVEGTLYEKRQQSGSFGKSWTFGITSYRAIDPVVLSITASIQRNFKRSDGNIVCQPGSYFLLSPATAFAVNDQVTFTAGFQWINRQADRCDNESQGFRQTRTDMKFGLGYGVSKESTLSFSFKANASGRDGADLRIDWLYAFL